MQFRSTALITGLFAVTGIVLGIGINVTPASATQVPVQNICTPANAAVAQCLNNRSGTVSAGNVIQFWENSQGGAANNAWNATVVGHVSDTGGDFWPFDGGSQLNDRYAGDEVWQFNLQKNSGYCAAQIAFTASSAEGVMNIQKCASSTQQDFVLSTSGYLVAAGASNTLFADYDIPSNPVWVSGLDGTENGELVWMSTSGGLTFSIKNTTLGSP